MTDQERIAKLEAELTVVMGMVAGLTSVVSSLIAKHHDHEQLLIHLASVVEIMELGPAQALSPKAQEVARTYVEHLSRIQAAPGEIRPFAR